MIETLKILIVDLFFILLITMCTEMLLDKKNFTKNQQTIVYCLTYGIALLLNLIFYAQVNNTFYVDLRHTVFVLAGLYGGVRCMPVLLLFIISYLGIMDSHEACGNLIAFTIELIAVAFLAKYYHNWRLRKKLAFLGLATLLNGLFVMTSVEYLFKIELDNKFLIIGSYAGAIMLVVTMLEWMRNSIAISHRIQRAEKLELVSHLAASISHEVRNPLTVTRGFLQLLEQENFSQEKKKEYLAIAKSELDRAEGIIRDYLTFAKPYPNKVELLNVKTELNHILDIIGPLANMRSVNIHSEIVACLITGEAQLFHQCLLNIIKNGIEAMGSDGGTLKIETRVGEDKVEILISDTGAGMTKNQIERLGEPYYSTRGKDGTGLGMMVVFSIVRSMKGKIHVDSQIGEGTTFLLQFPNINT